MCVRLVRLKTGIEREVARKTFVRPKAPCKQRERHTGALRTAVRVCSCICRKFILRLCMCHFIDKPGAHTMQRLGAAAAEGQSEPLLFYFIIIFLCVFYLRLFVSTFSFLLWGDETINFTRISLFRTGGDLIRLFLLFVETLMKMAARAHRMPKCGDAKKRRSRREMEETRTGEAKRNQISRKYCF